MENGPETYSHSPGRRPTGSHVLMMTAPRRVQDIGISRGGNINFK